MRFQQPVAGTMICLTEEKIARGLDQVQCIIEAPADHKITVNGTPCAWVDGAWKVTLPLSGKKNGSDRKGRNGRHGGSKPRMAL